MTTAWFSRELSVAAALSLALHATWLVQEAKASYKQKGSRAEMTLEAEVFQVPPKPEPTPVPAEENPRVEPAAQRLSAPRAASLSSRAAPAAAQAGKTLTAAADSDEVADFTLVQGEGSAYVGGTTSSVGTSNTAVHGPVASQPQLSGARNPVLSSARSAPDRSRSASPTGSAWDCSRLFPTDPEAGDYATVLIAVSLSQEGTPKRVALLRDPGHGFGAAAIQCAMRQRYNVALDREGNAVAATTPPITVRFSR
ncbi:MAG TPA: hypothetical protein VKP30_02180 [Polyangiaceae bacterium]|nr:hypothetical protein [Polyangiaceae bacterium]